MASTQQEVLECLIIYSVLRKKKTQKRTEFLHKCLLDRKQVTRTSLQKELPLYPSAIHTCLHMDDKTYFKLLRIVTPLIEKDSDVIRTRITPHERLTATLMFLATGRSYEDLKSSTCISPQALRRVTPETCRAIYQALVREYMKFPTSMRRWLKIAKQFNTWWQFPNCLGSLGGIHIAISPPPNSGSYYYNHKGFHSLVLMAIANANYELIYANFGTNGSVSDGEVLELTDFYEELTTFQLDIPPPSQNGLPYVFILDDSFALQEGFLKPYHVKTAEDKKKIFDYRISRVNRIIENVFGIMVSRFGVLRSGMNLKVEDIDDVVMACCVLHNFLRRNIPEQYTPEGSVDSEDAATHEMKDGLRAEGDNVTAVARVRSKYEHKEAREVRDAFVEYFNGDGKVPWQDRFLSLG